jgi:hypothetical protein
VAVGGRPRRPADALGVSYAGVRAPACRASRSRSSAFVEAPHAYEHFDARDDGWTKVVLHPAAA